MENYLIEKMIAEYPVYQYGFLKTSELVFEERVRHICKRECSRYGTSWSCPPAAGTVAECQKRCKQFEEVLVFTTLAETDAENLEAGLETRKGHEQLVHEIRSRLAASGEDTMTLSSDSCAICDTCTYPDKNCFHPDKMLPCIESHGILVTAAAEKLEMDFYFDRQTVLWFAMIFFHRKS